MAFDGIVSNSIVKELSPIIGSKIDKIYNPDKNTIVLGLYAQGFHYALNICIDAHNCRINLTTHSKPNPLVAPNFCMLLRKYLIGGKISNIYIKGLERIVYIDIETINEFNEIEIKTLIVEIMGKNSNIILVNPNQIIIDAIRHSSSNSNSYRDILPSHKYELPISNKLDFTTTNLDNFIANIDTDNLPKSISNTFTGFSLSFVQYSISRCSNDLEKLYNYFNDILSSANLAFEQYNENDYVLCIGKKNSDFQLNYFIDDFYTARESAEQFKNIKANSTKLVMDVYKKYNNRLLSMNKKLEECSNMDIYKLYGELITANLYRLTNTHSDMITLENYYDNNNPIEIPLDIKYNPQYNAKRYFKKYTKLKNAFQIVSAQKEETLAQIDYIESIIYELENCTNINDVLIINEEINENPIFKSKSTKRNKKKQANSKKKNTSFSPLKFEIDGYTIFVGRNNKENDWLSLTFANKDDMWFHTKDIHGSHVILRNDKPFSDDILVVCAKIAAKYSKASLSSNVPVDYCLAKFVKKPRSMNPGMVIFTNNKTINVNPLDLNL